MTVDTIPLVAPLVLAIIAFVLAYVGVKTSDKNAPLQFFFIVFAMFMLQASEHSTYLMMKNTEQATIGSSDVTNFMETVDIYFIYAPYVVLTYFVIMFILDTFTLLNQSNKREEHDS